MKLKRKCKIGCGNIVLRLQYMKPYDLIKETISFKEISFGNYGDFSYKISIVVDNNKKDILKGFNSLLRRAGKIREETYILPDKFIKSFK